MFNNRQYLRIKFLTRHKYQENLAGSDTGWKVGGGGGRWQGKILHPQQKIFEKCSIAL